MQGLSEFEITTRLLAAFAAGAIVGWERESRGRPAGFRTTILACTAAALAMIISEILYTASAVGLGATGGSWRPDPARLGAGILTGIGFLGAGTIIRHENLVRGVTTAASLWFVTVIGLAFGSGQFFVGGLGMAISVLTLFALPLMERHIASDWYATVSVTLEPPGISDDELLGTLRNCGLNLRTMKAQCEAPTGKRSLQIDVKCKRPRRFELCSEVISRLSKTPGVTHVSWE